MTDTNIPSVVAIPPAQPASGLLFNHHHRLEKNYREMLGWAETDNTRDFGAAWNDLGAELLEHMAAEEEVILPRYAEHAADDAHRIRVEHGQIRSLITSLGVDVDLHEVRIARLRRFVEGLEAHSASEDAAMYPWATAHIPLVGELLLAARIQRWCVRDEH